jgi:hypothetical protein
MGSADSLILMLAAKLLLDSSLESLRANEQRSLRFVSICGEMEAVRWLSYLEADLSKIPFRPDCDSTANRLLILIRRRFGHVAGSWRRFSWSAHLCAKKTFPHHKQSGAMEQVPHRRQWRDNW